MFYLCFSAGITALIFFAGLLLVKKRQPLLVHLSLLSGCLAVYLGMAAAGYRISDTPFREPVPIFTLLLLTGVVLNRLFGQLARLDNEMKGDLLRLIAVPVPGTATDLLVHLSRFFPLVNGWMTGLVRVLHVVSALILLWVCLKPLIRLAALYRTGPVTGTTRMVFLLALTGTLSLLTGLAGIFTQIPLLFAVMDGLVALSVLVGALLWFRYPLLAETFRQETVSLRYARSRLAGLDVEYLEKELADRVVRDKLYLKPDCSLDDLARIMTLSRHQVSELLNDRMGTGFSPWINAFRVEEAKQLLATRHDLNHLGIALDSGFSNKTSFNAFFKRQTGQTPREYRKKFTTLSGIIRPDETF
jgi:AraC-like DNA-binding protein